MGDQIKEAFGDASDWSPTDLRDLAEGDFIGKVIDPADLRKMDSAEVCANKFY